MERKNLSSVPGEDGLHVTYCRICEALCGMIAEVEDGKIKRLGPDHSNPHSRGHICVKGPALRDVCYDSDRVTQPLRRVSDTGEFEATTWGAALDEICSRLEKSISSNGEESFAINSGNPPSMGWPSAIGMAHFQTAMNCSRRYGPSSEDITTPVLAGEILFGTHDFVFPDLAQCEHLLIFGSNPLVSHGSLLIAPRFREDLDRIASKGRVIVIDPRRTETARKFEHIAVLPDGDVWLIGAMLNVIFREQLECRSFLEQDCLGWHELAEALDWLTPEVAEPFCGVSKGSIEELARDFAATSRAAAMGRIGICRGSFSTLTNFLLQALNIATGKFHQPGGVGWGHGATASDVKAKPVSGLAAHNAVPSRVSGIPSVWGSQSSLTFLEEMLTPGPGQIKSLFVIGANPVLSMPNGAELHRGFAQLDLMVALDLYVTETTRHADFILPVTTALEREDINQFFMNHMVRPFAQYAAPAIKPVGDARSEFQILAEIARRLGRGEPFDNQDPFELADLALRSGVEGRNGISLDKLKQHPHGVMIESGRWAFDFRKRIGHADGKIRLWDDRIYGEIRRLQACPKRDESSLRLINLRMLRSINSWMHNVEKLVRSDSPELLINSIDAAVRSISDGDRVIVSTNWGQVEVSANVTDEVRQGCIAYPHGWGHNGGWERANSTDGANLNRITPSSPDMAEQLSGMSYLEGFDAEVRLA